MWKKQTVTEAKAETSGIIQAVAAFLLWGILPLYWKLLKAVPAMEILAHRILWSFVFSALLLLSGRRGKEIKELLSQPKKAIVILWGALLVGTNWGIYIWAINADHVVDTSLGYYINPLLSVLLGVLILKERLNAWQLLALLLALAGVVTIAFQYGKIPWIALSLAVCFASYGLVKKVAKVEALLALTLETLFLLPLAIFYLVYLHFQGLGSFGTISSSVTVLLAGAGITTAIPLLWFGKALKKIPLSIAGFIQYLTPTLMLVIGVFFYQEPFSKIDLAGFALIWSALVLFSYSQFQEWRRFRAEPFRDQSF